ncbi:deoxynucleoside kinase [Burkholderia ambifaria]|uniref:deoxynucleoside kinase n=1 Tax=Burkholderia ambifaria TaxID=152480 RepID=UPI00158E549E|nr:deoxynucleoside kinase [Burkholderia ambifaria]
MTKAAFIAIEGCDGVGKSTIRNLLHKMLWEHGLHCSMVGQHSWLDLGASRVIVDVRERLRKREPAEISEAYFIDKRLHASATIEPALYLGPVISDRYIISDAVYQEALYGISAEETLLKHKRENTLLPDAILYVDAAVPTAYERILRRSKHTRHYERPVELAVIQAIYERIIPYCKSDLGIESLIFLNEHHDVEERVRSSILDFIIALNRQGTLARDA